MRALANYGHAGVYVNLVRHVFAHSKFAQQLAAYYTSSYTVYALIGVDSSV